MSRLGLLGYGFLAAMSFGCPALAVATAYYCPSPEFISYFQWVDAASADEALRQARAEWPFEYAQPADRCLTKEEWDPIYQKTFQDYYALTGWDKKIKPPVAPGLNPACAEVKHDDTGATQSVSLILQAKSGCVLRLSAEQQLFVAGAQMQFEEQCKQDSEAQLTAFTRLETLAATQGLQVIPSGTGPDRQLDRVPAMAQSQALLQKGRIFAKAQGEAACKTGAASAWSKGLKRYLDDTAHDPDAWFVKSCLAFYRDTVSKTQCECAAEVLRTTNPYIHTEQFTVDVLRDAAEQPVLGAALLACGALSFQRPPAPKPPADAALHAQCAREAEKKMGTNLPPETKRYTQRCIDARSR